MPNGVQTAISADPALPGNVSSLHRKRAAPQGAMITPCQLQLWIKPHCRSWNRTLMPLSPQNMTGEASSRRMAWC